MALGNMLSSYPHTAPGYRAKAGKQLWGNWDCSGRSVMGARDRVVSIVHTLCEDVGRYALEEWDHKGCRTLDEFWNIYQEYCLEFQQDWKFKPWLHPQCWVQSDPASGRMITVQYQSRCRLCGHMVRKGGTAVYYGRRTLVHYTCDLKRKGVATPGAKRLARADYNRNVRPVRFPKKVDR